MVGVLALQGAIEEHIAMTELAFKEIGIELKNLLGQSRPLKMLRLFTD